MKAKIVPNQNYAIRLDSCLCDLFPEIASRSVAISHIKNGFVAVDGVICRKPSFMVRCGQSLTFSLPAVQNIAKNIPDSPVLLPILYEDEDLLVVNKPANLTVHSAPSVKELTLVEILCGRYQELTAFSGERQGIVHRLDKDTSGLLVVARNESSRAALSEYFAQRLVEKEYLAFVRGVPSPSEDEITVPIGRHATLKTRMMINGKNAKEAKSRYRVLWSSPDGLLSLLSVRIFTGRTHQIRVHLASIGHPVLGDGTYGGTDFSFFGKKESGFRRLIKRQCLHAWKLGFSQPTSGEPLRFCTPPPDDFLRIFLFASRRALKIGLTGIAACGKSAVLQELANSGVPTWSADAVVAKLYQSGADGTRLLTSRFGERFLSEDGSVDKKKLLQVMREEKGLMSEVSDLLFPLVLHRLQNFFADPGTASVCVAEVPLLVEAGWKNGLFDLVCTVFCKQAVRQNCLAVRGWDFDLTEQVDKWQCSQTKKVQAADIVLANVGSLQDLQAQTKKLLWIFRELQQKKIQARIHFYKNLVSAEKI